MQGWGLSADCQSSPSSLAKSKGTQPGVGGRVRWSLWQMTEWQEWSTVEYARYVLLYLKSHPNVIYYKHVVPRWELRTEEAVSFQAGPQSDWNFCQRILPATCSLSLSLSRHQVCPSSCWCRAFFHSVLRGNSMALPSVRFRATARRWSRKTLLQKRQGRRISRLSSFTNIFLGV